MTTLSTLTRLAAAILLPCHLAAAAATAAEPEIYPVLWSASLGLESLDGIDERLNRPFWPHEDGLRIYKEVEGNYWRQAMATDCFELLELSADGYYGLDNESMYLHLFLCRALPGNSHAWERAAGRDEPSERFHVDPGCGRISSGDGEYRPGMRAVLSSRRGKRGSRSNERIRGGSWGGLRPHGHAPAATEFN